jgi:hypothetical protein
MQFDKTLDELIEAGWHVVNTEFDKQAYLVWKKKAYDFLNDFVGPDHAYTQDFGNSFDSMTENTKKGKIICKRCTM